MTPTSPAATTALELEHDDDGAYRLDLNNEDGERLRRVYFDAGDEDQAAELAVRQLRAWNIGEDEIGELYTHDESGLHEEHLATLHPDDEEPTGS